MTYLMFRRNLVWVLFLIATFGQGQDSSPAPQSLRELRNAPNDTARAEALARICIDLTQSNPDSARLMGEQALALAKRIGNRSALGNAHNNLGRLAAEQGEMHRADSLLTIALGIFEHLGQPAYASAALSNLGWVAEKNGDSAGSLKRFQQALALSEQANDSANVSALLWSIGTALRKTKDFDKSIAHLERARALEHKLRRPIKEGNCLVALASTFAEKGDTTGAISACQEAVVLYSASHDHQGLGLVEMELGDLERESTNALDHYRTALAHYDTIQSPPDQARVLLRMGHAQLELGELRVAEASMTTGYSLVELYGDTLLTMEYELGLARLAAALGDAGTSMRHYERFTTLRDSLEATRARWDLLRLRRKLSEERTEVDSALMSAQESENDEHLRREKNQIYSNVAIGVLVLVVALLLYRDQRQKREQARSLREVKMRLAVSNAEIAKINGLVETRLLRSPMNPHFIHNCLNNTTRMMQAGKQPEALAYLQDLARLLDMVLDQSLKERIFIGEELDFLRQYLALEAHRMDGLSYEVDADRTLIEGAVELPALMVQPFVENAVWQGLSEGDGARRLQVHFSMDGGKLHCEITDNGAEGMRAAKERDGHVQRKPHGVPLANERLRLLTRRLEENGPVRVKDLPDDGESGATRVRLEVPLAN